MTKLEGVRKAHSAKKHRSLVAAGLAVIVGLTTIGSLVMPASALAKTETVLACSYDIHEHEGYDRPLANFDGSPLKEVVKVDPTQGGKVKVTDEDGNVVPAYTRAILTDDAGRCLQDADGYTLDASGKQVLDAAGQPVKSCYALVQKEDGSVEKQLICGEADYVIHTHDASCYEDGKLVCGLKETPEHKHDASCYKEEKVLICGEKETAAHVHDDSCYTETRTLTCPVEEHVHTDECYAYVDNGNVSAEAVDLNADGVIDESETAEAEAAAAAAAQPERVLVCGKEEHVHGDDCYQVERELTCTESTEPAHVHTAACYKTEKVLVCGKLACHYHGPSCFDKNNKLICDETVLVKHQHSDACFEKVAADRTAAGTEADSDAGHYPARTFDGKAGKLTVTVDAPEGAFPEGTTMTVAAVKDAKQIEKIEQAAAEEAGSDIKSVSAVDITFLNADGDEIEPLVPISVVISDSSAEAETANSQALVVHLDDAGKTEIIEQTETATDEGTVAFEAEKFSVYAVVYTVDFHWEAEGKTYEFRLPGGGFVSLRDLVEVLGMADGIYNSSSEGNSEANSEEGNAKIADADIDEFLADVENVAFSNPELANISRAEENTTVGVIKEALGLECEYSAELTAEDIAEINATEVRAGDWTLISLKAFDTEETLTVTMKDGNQLVVKVTDAQIQKAVIDARGDTWDVTVTYDDSAQIPDGADLEVNEILQSAEATDEGTEYETYLEKTREALGLESGVFAYARFFDIKIVDKNGKTVKIAAPVDVKIELMDKAIGEEDDTRVVHFADGSKSGNVVAVTTEDENEGRVVSFEAEGFSVYAVVTLDDLSELEGSTYGIINTKNGTSPKGVALMSSATGNGTKLTGKDTTVKVDVVGRVDNVYVAQNSNITMWNFADAGDGKCYITATVGSKLKYLKISSSGLSLVDVDEADSDCIITVTPGTGSFSGKYKFSSANGALQLNGTTFQRAAANATAETVWMNLAKLSTLNDDDFVIYEAAKVSVSGTPVEESTETSIRLSDGTYIDYDINNGDQVIIYTRIWNKETMKYDYYAIDYDGMLIKAYESGDTISWVGSKINTMLWDFTEYYDEGTSNPNYYYELKNNYSGKYIAPQISQGSFLSDNKIGINLNGRRYKEYYSTVLAWDNDAFDYATLGVDEQSMQLDAAKMSLASDFYFARMTEKQQTSELTQVATIDHTAFGIRLKMQNYANVGSNNRSQTQTDVLKDLTYNQWGGVKNLLSKYIAEDGNGYPVSTLTGKSLSELYSEAITVNNQFLQGTYQETGYFEYNSTQNFAHLITSPNDKWYGQPSPSGDIYDIGDFVIYNQIASTTESSGETRRHGQFFPYNDLTEGSFITNYVNDTDIHGTALSSLDPRKGEKLYKLQFKNQANTDPAFVDFFFGMEMDASFMQSASGLDAWGHDLIFEFSGDDDFWLYIDNVLVLDLGGIHSALDGSVNFRTGKVIENGKESTLRERFETAYKAQYPNKTQDEVNTWLNGIFKDGGTVFKDYSGHTMKMYYQERGAGASNLHMRFNLAPYVGGQIELEKEVSGSDSITTPFPFQIYYSDSTNHIMGIAGSEGHNDITVIDSVTEEAIPQSRYTIVSGDVSYTYEHVYFLTPGQIANIKLPGEDTEYFIRECGLADDTFDEVKVNEEHLDGTRIKIPNKDPAEYISGYKDYEIEKSTVQGRKKVIYDNHVDKKALKSLTVTKRLWQDHDKQKEIVSGSGTHADNQEFKFRIYIGRNGENYTVYNTGLYYIKDPDGYYCYYDSSSETFVKFQGGAYGDGIKDISLLSTVDPGHGGKSDLEKAEFHTSPGGAAEKIRAGYSIEIPGLLSGTPFFIEERDYEVPTGYNLLGYTFTDGKYSSENQGKANNSGVIGTENDPTVSVHNQHGYGLTVNKIWSDADFMASHDPLYFGVYLDDQLINGTVRQMMHPNTSIRWFFPALAPNKTLNVYQVYEIVPKGEYTVNQDTGEVTGYTDVVKKEEGQTIDVKAVGNDLGYSSSYTYTVGYDREELTNEEIANKVNQRTDTVKNSRPGIRLVKTDLEGKVLSGATFTLAKASEPDNKKTFVSDSNGLIAVAYLLPNTEYVLTETGTPFGYQALIESLTIKVNDENQVYINGSERGTDNYSITQVPYANQSLAIMPVVKIKNERYTLQAVKIDAYSNEPMPDVKFNLYREVLESGTGSPMPDYTPLSFMDEDGNYTLTDLVTDSYGIIPKLVLKSDENLDGLTPGTYYLREVTPSGYKSLGIDIRITISDTGGITLTRANRPAHSGSWTIETLSDNIASVSKNGTTIKITIRNTPNDAVKIIKKEEGTNNLLEGVSFALYKIGQINMETMLPKENEIPIVSGETDDSGVLNLGGIENNTSYYLYETSTLDGYNLLSAPVIISSTADNKGVVTIRATLDRTPLTCSKKQDSHGVTVWEITVYNSTGYELPSTGGPGTRLFTILGGLLMTGAVVLLWKRRRLV